MFMKEDTMIELREQERKTLLAIERLGGKASAKQVINESGMSRRSNNAGSPNITREKTRENQRDKTNYRKA